MLTRGLTVKLVDFGLSRLFPRRGLKKASPRASALRAGASSESAFDATSHCGTARYMAP